MGLRLSASNKQSPLLIAIPRKETWQPLPRRAHLPWRRNERELGDGRCQTWSQTAEAGPDGAQTQFAFRLARAVGRREPPDGAAPVPPTEQLLLRLAEEAQAVGVRAQNSGFVTVPPALCLLVSSGIGWGAAALEEAAPQNENSSFLPLLGSVPAQAGAEGLPGQRPEPGVPDPAGKAGELPVERAPAQHSGAAKRPPLGQGVGTVTLHSHVSQL